MKTIWVDLLCLRSVLKIFFLSRIIAIDKIYYISRTKYLSSFFINILVRLVKKPVRQMNWIAEGDEKIDGISLYELIQIRLIKVLQEWLSREDISKESERFCKKYKYNLIKFKEYLREEAYWHLFRLVEISVLAEKVSGKNDSLYIFHSSPFNQVVKTFLRTNPVYFYNSWFLFHRCVEQRKNYVYDYLSNSHYFSNRVESVGWIWILYLSSFVNSILCKIFKKNIHGEDTKSVNIGVELIVSKIRMDEINDLYWLQDSAINPKTVWGIEHVYYDQESKNVLTSLGIRRCKVVKDPLRLFSLLINNRDSDCQYVTIGLRDYLETTVHILRLFLAFLFWNKYGWLQYKKTTYAWGTLFWNSIYKQLGVRMLWSMGDIDSNKLLKAQALEKLDGLFMGSHWSNYPMFRVDIQKCFDVLFTWGDHFVSNNYNRYPYMKIFQTGYPLDHYFEKRRSKAVRLRNRYAEKFILSYQDNVMANDLPYSKNMQIQIHEVLLSVLKKYGDVVVFLKPKRKCIFDTIIKEASELREYINKGRIVTFFGETSGTKAVPAEIGMASDLVVGLGISTAAAECQFAGTLSFHVDLTGFTKNEFGNNGLGHVVFRDIPSLHKAILEQIHNSLARERSDYKAFYETLDPFQDGQAYKRTGFVLKNLQELLGQSLSREEAVKEVRKRYEKSVFLKYKQINKKRRCVNRH